MLCSIKIQQAKTGKIKLGSIGKDEVPGSNPGNSSKTKTDPKGSVFVLESACPVEPGTSFNHPVRIRVAPHIPAGSAAGAFLSPAANSSTFKPLSIELRGLELFDCQLDGFSVRLPCCVLDKAAVFIPVLILLGRERERRFRFAAHLHPLLCAGLLIIPLVFQIAAHSLHLEGDFLARLHTCCLGLSGDLGRNSVHLVSPFLC